MMDDQDDQDDQEQDLAAALEEALAAPAATAGAHPSPEQLVAYHHDRLPPAEIEPVQEHLAQCRLCADLLLELVRFTGEEDGARPGLVDFEAEAAWRQLAPRLREEIRADSTAEISPPERRKRAPVARLAYGLAAALLISTVGLGLWAGRLRGQLDALRRPQANVPILNLEPAGFARGDDAQVVARAGRRSVLILNPTSFPAPASYRVEILAAGGARLWSGEGLLPTGAGNFNLELPGDLLTPGTYRLRLLRDGEEAAKFDLRVIP